MIYYAEDDESIRELVVYTLKKAGYEAVGFADADSFTAAVSEKLPELVLLDIMLPGRDGLSILETLKTNAATTDIPVIMITAKNTEFDKVTGLDCGADDYISKPFGMMEFISRVKAVLRRSEKKQQQLVCGGIVIDTLKHTVTSNGEAVELTLKEYELLDFLMTNRGMVFERDRLLNSIWGYDYFGGSRTVDVHITTLRKKLGENGELIKTVRGVGYKIGE